MAFYKDDSSDEFGHRGDLVISGPVTRERLAQFLRLPVLWDVDGGRESVWRAFSQRHDNLFNRLLEIDFKAVPVRRIPSIIIDPGATLSPATTPHSHDPPVFLRRSGYAHRRHLCIELENATPSVHQTVEQIFDFADPAFNPEQEEETPVVLFKIKKGDLPSVEQFVGSVSKVVTSLDIPLTQNSSFFESSWIPFCVDIAGST